MVELVEQSGLLHGYPEDQIFAPSVTRGRQIMWSRAAALTGRPYLPARPKSTAAPIHHGFGKENCKAVAC